MTKKGDKLLRAIKSQTLWRAMIANVSSEHNIKEELVLPARSTHIHPLDVSLSNSLTISRRTFFFGVVGHGSPQPLLYFSAILDLL